MRELSQLIDVEEPAWPELKDVLGGGPVSVEVLPPDGDLGRASLLQLQVTTRSYLGAVILRCGGLLVDGGWLRVFGSPVDGAAHGMASLARINQFPGAFDPAWRADTGLLGGIRRTGGRLRSQRRSSRQRRPSR